MKSSIIRAWKSGWFNDEVSPVYTHTIEKDESTKNITIKFDDGIRPETTAESLSKLKAAFSDGKQFLQTYQVLT